MGSFLRLNSIGNYLLFIFLIIGTAQQSYAIPIGDEHLKTIEKISGVKVYLSENSDPTISYNIDNQEYCLAKDTDELIKIFLISSIIDKFLIKKFYRLKEITRIINGEQEKGKRINTLLNHFYKSRNELIIKMRLNKKVIDNIINEYSIFSFFSKPDNNNSKIQKEFFVSDNKGIELLKQAKVRFKFLDDEGAHTNQRLLTISLNSPALSYKERMFLLEMLYQQNGMKKYYCAFKAAYTSLEYLESTANKS